MSPPSELQEIPVAIREHTDDPRRKTLALADNATSDDVEWDFDAIEADGWTEGSAGGWGVEWPADEEQNNESSKQQKDLSSKINAEYKIEVSCVNEAEQEKLYNELIGEGYECRILTL